MIKLNSLNARVVLAFLLTVGLFSCQQELENLGIEKAEQKAELAYQSLPKYPEPIIGIATSSFVPDMALQLLKQQKNGIDGETAKHEQVPTRSAYEIISEETWSNGFGRTINARSSECVLMENLHRHIYLGSVLQAASVANYDYKSVSVATKPINVSVSFPAEKVTGTISNPSLSRTRQFVMDLMQQKGIGKQSASVSLDIKQFTAYNQLRTVFGSNVSTATLFGKTSSSISENSATIQKSTGLYVKFIQKYFTLDMDVPQDGFVIGDVHGDYSPIYVSSIAYGRLGVMVIETDYDYTEAESLAKSTVNKLLYKKTTTLTTDEQNFIMTSDIKIYLVGGKGESGVQSVTGVEGFVKHLTEGGEFSASTPGTPIYCSFANLSDNSPYKVNFRFDIDSPPVYARVEYGNISNNDRYAGPFLQREKLYGDAWLAFYADQQALVPTIPPRYIEFELSKVYKEKYKRRNQMIKDDVTITDFSKHHLTSGIRLGISVNTLFTYFVWQHTNPRTATHTEKTERYQLKQGVFYKTLPPRNVPKSWMNSN